MLDKGNIECPVYPLREDHGKLLPERAAYHIDWSYGGGTLFIPIFGTLLHPCRQAFSPTKMRPLRSIFFS